METQSILKTAKLILMISLILNIILVTTVVMQHKYITENMKDLKEFTLSETNIKDNHSGSKTVDPSPKIIESLDGISDKGKIKNLESQINDMQDWQDYLEEKLAKYEITSEERYYKLLKGNLSSRFEPFAEENNLSPAN